MCNLFADVEYVEHPSDIYILYWPWTPSSTHSIAMKANPTRRKIIIKIKEILSRSMISMLYTICLFPHLVMFGVWDCELKLVSHFRKIFSFVCVCVSFVWSWKKTKKQTKSFPLLCSHKVKELSYIHIESIHNINPFEIESSLTDSSNTKANAMQCDANATQLLFVTIGYVT